MAHAKHHYHFTPETFRLEAGLWSRVRNTLAFIALVSWIAVAAGWILEPASFYQSYLVGFLMALGIPLGAMFFVMVQYLTGSAWSVPMRRIAESLAVSVAICALLFIPIVFGIHTLFEWSHTEVVAKDPVLSQKAGYLNETWFLIRAAIYFTLWIIWSVSIYRHSVRQDSDHSIEHMHSNSRWSAPGLLMVMLTASLAAIDWIMSLTPHWYSTMWGIYYMSGAALSFVAVWTLICLGFRQSGILTGEIRREHYHDLGKWIFALVCFWGYISFSQYMLIWYGNIPEETIWFRQRGEGIWHFWFLLLVWGHFILPFLLLTMRSAKRNYKMLAIMGVWALLMEYADIYFMVIPTFRTHAPLHWLDIACVGATLSVLGLFFWTVIRPVSLIPVGDPRLLQGLEFENV